MAHVFREASVVGGSAIRGSKIGSGPMGESERGEAAPRVAVSFWCSQGHETVASFAVEVTVPGARLYDNDGHWFWEGEGVSPDFEVWDDPNLLVQGRDPQIEKVVEEVLKLLKQNPPKRTPAPPFEDRTAKGLKNKK